MYCAAFCIKYNILSFYSYYLLLSHTEEGTSSLVSLNNNPSNTILQLKHLASYKHPKML